ncbi:hypothetical protein [Flavobacterium rhizosphaerae]|uniref:Uncharacterized protein n=1 Tax=Flavobacterium rhizosphaerae TaxID=3163298 RepID=A0ABW8YVT8_9FLAO
MGQDINDNDQDRDMQLPFKHIDQHSYSIIYIPAPAVEQIVFVKHKSAEKKIMQQKNLHSFVLFTSLLRPPRNLYNLI